MVLCTYIQEVGEKVKKVYEYLCQFIEYELSINESSKNNELKCKEYKKTELKLNDLKNNQEEIKKNIIDRLNSIFNIKPKWYRKGFTIEEFRGYYELVLPRLDKTSKEYYCLNYLWGRLGEKYNNYKYDYNIVYRGFYPISFEIHKR